MKMLKKLPRKVCLPEIGNVLPFVAAGLLLLWGLWGYVVQRVSEEAGMVSGNILLILAAVLLFASQRKSQSIGLYRVACLMAALGCSNESNGALLLVAAALFVVSFNLWGNVSLDSTSGLLRRPVAALSLLVMLAILLVDQIVFIIRDFYLLALGDLFGIAGLIVLVLSLETRDHLKIKAPRMQSVPKDGSVLFGVAVALLMGALSFAFINRVKMMCGVSVTETIRAALAAPYAVTIGDIWQPLLAYLISMGACILMLGSERKKNFLPAVVLLFFMSNPLALRSLLDIGGMGENLIDLLTGIAFSVVMLLLLISAVGLKKWNEPMGKSTVMNTVTLLVAVSLACNLTSSTLDNVTASIADQKNLIVEAVKDASEDAVYDAAYNDELSNNTLQAAFDASYAAVKEATYDPAYKAAQEVGRKDVNITPEQLESYTKSIAESISNAAAEYSMQGMEIEIYESMVDMLAELPASEIAMQEVFDEAPAAREDFRAEMEKTLRRNFNTNMEYSSGRGTVKEMYLAACKAATPLMFDAAFAPAYNTVYDSIYDLLNNVAVETANETLAEYDGTVYLRAAGVVLRALPGVVEIIALALLTASLTAQPVAQTKTCFRRLLDWCYTGVGEKLKKCVKTSGGVYLALGALGLLAIPVGILLIPTAPVEVFLVLIGGGLATLLVVAILIILTYPLYEFAQQVADVHAIRNGAGVVLTAAPAEEAPAAKTAPVIPAAPAEPVASAAPVAPVVSVAEEVFNPDELPDL